MKFNCRSQSSNNIHVGILHLSGYKLPHYVGEVSDENRADAHGASQAHRSVISKQDKG
jgi:hypothetical protein